MKLSAFYIDKYEVTNGEYKLCVDAGPCEPIDVTGGGHFCPDGTYADAPEWDDPANSSVPVLRHEYKNAVQYCAWMGKRLPTEAEWERAARGPEAFNYPWGNTQPDCGRMPYLSGCENWSLCNGAETEVPPRGSSPGDISIEGVFDLNASVCETVMDYYDPDFYGRSPLENPVNLTIWGNSEGIQICRGDSFAGFSAMGYLSIPDSTNAVSWKTVPSWIRKGSATFMGFRCARDDDEEEYIRQFIQLRNMIIKGGRP